MNEKRRKPERAERGPANAAGKPERNRAPEEKSGAPQDEVRERIAKRIARSGLTSRRDAEAMVVAGRVKVNGNALSSPAFNVGPNDIIVVDGQRLADRERTRLFLFHKPSGTMSTNRDPEGRKTIFDILPPSLPRLMTIGRLDYTTEGLLLLTNDGGLARVLELPSTGWLRRYRVRVHGDVDENALADLKEGIAVDGVLYGAIDASLERKQGSNAWLTVALREGKNREIKKVLGALGLEVNRLIRISYGPFQLSSLETGNVMELKGRTLREQLGERLIAEAGADFDSDIKKPFSNKPATKDHKAGPTAATPDKERRKSFREEGLERLQTSPPTKPGNKGPAKGDRKRDEDGEKGRETGPPPRSRASNVWMAPGARPSGAKALGSPTDAKKGGRKPRSNEAEGRGRPGRKDADRRR